MAYRLGDFVVYGEIRNKEHYSTHGFLVLRGEHDGSETQILLNLTGNCARDLRGKSVRFWPHPDYPETAVFRPEEHKGLRLQQIGATGTMTAEGWVRMLPCPVDEYLRRVKLGEPPPTPWERRVYLEWYSQNGRVVVELPGACVEELVAPPKDEGEEGEWRELPNLGLLPDAEDPARDTGVQATVIQRNPSGGFRAHVVSDDEDPIADLELFDACLEEGDGTPLVELLGGHWPRPETLEDAEAEGYLKALLGQMALFGIALHVCEHYTPRQTYTLLVNTILPEERAYEELAGTGWVQNFMTSEFCEACEQRILEEYERDSNS